jgi:hypothetical protein
MIRIRQLLLMVDESIPTTKFTRNAGATQCRLRYFNCSAENRINVNGASVRMLTDPSADSATPDE